MNQFNNKRERHGYWEYYWQNSKLMYKGNYTNGEKSGLWEWYSYNSSEIIRKHYYIL